ncbi:MAG: arginase family hydrolase, arginase/agmainase/formiminoglutamate hydrolase [Bacteroidetes bacterium]|jgi:formiminoglutamase|nr:arginase family hydrolase, arginase/agmainase/formiminoglutamate hydrolase [Bacteroidota bacterium]
MKVLELYSKKDIEQLTRKRTNEVKIGEDVFVLASEKNWETELKNMPCKFVLFGIPEDIGVRANYGRGGAHTAWKPALDSFLSQQSNEFLTGKDVCVLGHIFVDDLMEQSLSLNIKNKNEMLELRNLVSIIDQRVSDIISKIISCGKIPIVVGGGHNNSYPIIMGCSLALNQKINVINCDPHTDFRPLEGRHSGNGFSYAYRENYLNKYSVFCIHEQYNTTSVLKDFTNDMEHLYYSRYEDVFVREINSFSNTLNQNIGYVKQNGCGVELDLDAITNVPSSAKTSSGISPVQARQYAYQCGKQLNALYFHIAEGAPILSHIKADNKTGKLIGYLIADFIKGVADK